MNSRDLLTEIKARASAHAAAHSAFRPPPSALGPSEPWTRSPLTREAERERARARAKRDKAAALAMHRANRRAFGEIERACMSALRRRGLSKEIEHRPDSITSALIVVLDGAVQPLTVAQLHERMESVKIATVSSLIGQLCVQGAVRRAGRCEQTGRFTYTTTARS